MKTTIQLAVLIFTLLSSADLHAYEVMRSESGDPLHWTRDDMPLEWYLNKDGCPDLPFEDTLIALESAFDSWQGVDCSYVEFKYAGTRETSDFGPNAHNTPDFKNTISWVESDWPDEWTEAYAVTIPAYDLSNGRIVDADMEFNADWFTWAILSGASSEKPDLQNIATHEIGHFIGLDHADDIEASLYPFGVPGELHKRTLAEDDIFGICNLYPLEGASGWPCGNDDDCSGGRKCIVNSDTQNSLCSQSCYCDQDCPPAMECINDYCMPKRHEIGHDMGDTCSISLPCIESLICLEDICSDYCSNSAQCPEDWDCVPITDGGRACYGEPEDKDGDIEVVGIYAFNTDRQSPQNAGTKIKLSAEIEGNGECRFIARHSSGNYTYINSYSPKCQTTWLPTETGSYELFAEVRATSSESCYDVRESIFFTIMSGNEAGGEESENGDAEGTSDGSDDDGGCNSSQSHFPAITIAALGVLLLLHKKRKN